MSKTDIISAKDIVNEILESYHIYDIMDSTTEFIIYVDGRCSQVIITKIDDNTWQEFFWLGQEKKKYKILTSKEELLNALSSSILGKFLFSGINDEDFDTKTFLFKKATNLKQLITDKNFIELEQFNIITYKYNDKFKYLF